MSATVVDLYSGAGGVGLGLDRLDIDHVGVDIVDHEETYPGEHVVADCSYPGLVAGLVDDVAPEADPLVLWMSPPCQRYSQLAKVNASRYDWDDGEIEERYPGFEELNVQEVIDRAQPDYYIVENVPGAPLDDPSYIDGLAFGQRFRLRRAFETNFFLPNFTGSGRPEITLSTNPESGNEDYQRSDLAREKGVPVDWPEESVHAAISPVWVQAILSYVPELSIDLPEALEQRPLDEWARSTGGESA